MRLIVDFNPYMQRSVILIATILLVLMMIAPAHAASRGTMIAMAVALLDVAEEHCIGRVAINQSMRRRLYLHFHEYDIGGLASSISQPLNLFYEEFAAQAQAGRDGFCKAVPLQSARTGYPVITALGN